MFRGFLICIAMTLMMMIIVMVIILLKGSGDKGARGRLASPQRGRSGMSGEKVEDRVVENVLMSVDATAISGGRKLPP